MYLMHCLHLCSPSPILVILWPFCLSIVWSSVGFQNHTKVLNLFTYTRLALFTCEFCIVHNNTFRFCVPYLLNSSINISYCWCSFFIFLSSPYLKVSLTKLADIIVAFFSCINPAIFQLLKVKIYCLPVVTVITLHSDCAQHTHTLTML